MATAWKGLKSLKFRGLRFASTPIRCSNSVSADRDPLPLHFFTWVKVTRLGHLDSGFRVLLELADGLPTDADYRPRRHARDKNFQVVHAISVCA